MNQKVQQLINDGKITVNDVLEYANNYQIEKYYEEEYNSNVESPKDEHNDDPEYIIASTSYEMEETFVFEADEDGQIRDFGEFGGLAKRWGCHNWQDYHGAVEVAFGKGKYQFVRRMDTIDKIAHFLFKRIDGEPEHPFHLLLKNK